MDDPKKKLRELSGQEIEAVTGGNPSPPTNGGNGTGHSGQCTGNPNDRPASCGPH